MASHFSSELRYYTEHVFQDESTILILSDTMCQTLGTICQPAWPVVITVRADLFLSGWFRDTISCGPSFMGSMCEEVQGICAGEFHIIYVFNEHPNHINHRTYMFKSTLNTVQQFLQFYLDAVSSYMDACVWYFTWVCMSVVFKYVQHILNILEIDHFTTGAAATLRSPGSAQGTAKPVRGLGAFQEGCWWRFWIRFCIGYRALS